MKEIRELAAALLLLVPGVSPATVVFDTWTSNDSATGNYIVSITDVGSKFDINVTVSPWNAEVLGLFLDFGNVNVGSASALALTNVSPVGQVSVYAVDTASAGCGMGCTLNGLATPLVSPDGQWEAIFRLGAQGFDGIQTFSFTINDLGLGEDDIKLVGIRAQQLCGPGGTLSNGDTGCSGSDKAYSSEGRYVPEPGSLALLALAMFGVAAFRRSSRT